MNNEEVSRRSQRPHKDRGGRGRGSILKRIFLWALSLFVLAFVALAALFFYYASSAPTITENDLKSQTTTTIYDANNKVISRLGAQKREYASNSEIPTLLKHGVVAIEDRHFYQGHGVDPVRIVEAAIDNVLHRSNGMQGGSTITQQLVKLSVFSTAASDQTFKRKAQEAWLAINVERHFTKNQILDFYINKVYMGNGVYGMKTAAQYYYGKSLKELDLSQLALLAGIPQSPTYYNPANTDTKPATQRRNEVLAAMVRAKYITQAQANAAMKENVTDGLDSTHGNTSSNDSSVDEKVVDSYVKEVLTQLEAKGYNPNTDGLQVHTSLDLGAQEELYNSANNTVPFQSDKMQTGVAVVNPHNGQVVAMLGGRKTGDVVYGLNRAVQTDRSSGSTAKPIMDYGPAIQYLKWPTYYALSDTKFTFPGTNTVLHDFDNQYMGTMTMRTALVESRNVPAVRTLQAVGISRATKFLKGLGISQKSAYTLANGIGLYVSPLQIAASYAAFANGGTYYKPYYITSITTQDGNTINYNKSGKTAMNKATAYMITDMLKGVINSSDGSGTAAKLSGVNQAGKTGTTSAYSAATGTTSNTNSGVMDSWMAGYTKNYSIAVWTGFDNAKTSISSSYTKAAQYLYRDVMQYLDAENHASDWTMPSTVEAVQVNGVRQLVIKDSKWALTVTSSTSSSSSNSSSSTSSSSSSSRSSSSSSSSESSSSSSIYSSSSSSSSTPSSSSSSSNSASTPTPASSTPTTTPTTPTQ
ncbi:penicillin-binding protein 1A [Limosilactobacillus fermentum NB-22]|uniref:Penicillin-binding protein 1A n=1 Tax=Limosilactobacillus fermentum NB-22 TaxID=1408443 RepID=A0A829LW31_LIMFE|nr:transglycosylase domain-containing protein [Limosilactobacillus fermentum]ESS01780.1 penicillin-binding protein 1A [Limosilactobacillus fermentum NB-22]MCH5395276.1 penicillin-binding protein [Limosilactobacillus fermentum]